MTPSTEPASEPAPEAQSDPPVLRLRRADRPALIALGAVFIGWFFLDTLTMTVGAFSDGFRFYALGAIIARPLRLVTGLTGDDRYLVLPFALLCLVTLAATLAPYVSRHPLARYGRFAPLALMLISGSVLYREASRDAFIAAPDAGQVAAAVTSFANALARRAGGVLAQHISVGAGAWVALLGASYVAVAGLRGRSAPPW
jgi:hypothetical protein